MEKVDVDGQHKNGTGDGVGVQVSLRLLHGIQDSGVVDSAGGRRLSTLQVGSFGGFCELVSAPSVQEKDAEQPKRRAF